MKIYSHHHLLVIKFVMTVGICVVVWMNLGSIFNVDPGILYDIQVSSCKILEYMKHQIRDSQQRKALSN